MAVPGCRVVARLDHFADVYVVNPGRLFARQAIPAHDKLPGFKAMNSQHYLANGQWDIIVMPERSEFVNEASIAYGMKRLDVCLLAMRPDDLCFEP
jgi:hypothetical protein